MWLIVSTSCGPKGYTRRAVRRGAVVYCGTRRRSARASMNQLNTTVRIRGDFTFARWRPDCLADDAVSCEPVSTSKFPGNREMNREFRKNGPSNLIWRSWINPRIQ